MTARNNDHGHQQQRSFFLSVLLWGQAGARVDPTRQEQRSLSLNRRGGKKRWWQDRFHLDVNLISKLSDLSVEMDK